MKRWFVIVLLIAGGVWIALPPRDPVVQRQDSSNEPTGERAVSGGSPRSFPELDQGSAPKAPVIEAAARSPARAGEARWPGEFSFPADLSSERFLSRGTGKVKGTNLYFRHPSSSDESSSFSDDPQRFIQAFQKLGLDQDSIRTDYLSGFEPQWLDYLGESEHSLHDVATFRPSAFFQFVEPLGYTVVSVTVFQPDDRQLLWEAFHRSLASSSALIDSIAKLDGIGHLAAGMPSSVVFVTFNVLVRVVGPGAGAAQPLSIARRLDQQIRQSAVRVSEVEELYSDADVVSAPHELGVVLQPVRPESCLHIVVETVAKALVTADPSEAFLVRKPEGMRVWIVEENLICREIDGAWQEN